MPRFTLYEFFLAISACAIVTALFSLQLEILGFGIVISLAAWWSYLWLSRLG